MSAWDVYTADLAALGQWEPIGVLARDAVAMAKESPGGPGVALQALAMLGDVWEAMPASFRGELRGALTDALATASQAASEFNDVPVAQVVTTIIAGVERIAGAVSGTNAIKRAASNYAHGDGQFTTAQQLLANPSHQFYRVLPVYEYAQFVKIRAGGDFDRKPSFTRWGSERDRIFASKATSKATGNCRKKLRRSGADSYGPFAPSCGAKLGLSALFWPWWSAVYSPGYLPQWQGSPEGAKFQAGPSPDTNALLAGMQSGLLTDAATNARASLATLDRVVGRFLAWFDGAGPMRPVRQDGANLVSDGAPAKAVDASKAAGHVPSESAGAYWYRGGDNIVVPYDGQPGASLGRWGVELPPGDPAGLAVSLEMRNAVVAARAAFAQRRLATLRSPRLVEALAADHGGLGAFDAGAREAMRIAMKSGEETLPYPGASAVKRSVVRRPEPGTLGGPKGGGAGLGLLLFLLGGR